MKISFNNVPLGRTAALILLAASLGVAPLSGCSNKEASTEEDSSIIVEKIKSEEDKDREKPMIVAGPRHFDRIRVNNIGPLKEIFNDSNKFQLARAQEIGIEPLSDLRSAYFTSRPVVHIESNEYYVIDSLSHSVPFLVPEAAKLLTDIGKNFIDSLAQRGADGYKIKVTSLLRTPATVKKLRRVNRNATDSSTHQYATTFDISYARFYCEDSTRTINDGDLKNLLAEVLYDLKKQGRCYVKFERRSPCFHITAIR